MSGEKNTYFNYAYVIWTHEKIKAVTWTHEEIKAVTWTHEEIKAVTWTREKIKHRLLYLRVGRLQWVFFTGHKP